MYKQEAVYIVISISVKYLKITKISPGLIELREHFLGLYSGGLIFWGGLYLGFYCMIIIVAFPSLNKLIGGTL